MQRSLPVLCLLLTACPPKQPPPPEEPSGRCEVDLESLGLFSSVGTGVHAQLIDSTDQLIGGQAAQGRVGDYLLENDRIRVVIQAPGRTISPTPYGGTIIDADVVRGGGPGKDAFGKLEVLYAFGRTLNVSRVEVLRDAARGGYGVIAATGADAVLDYINVGNVLDKYVGNGVQLVRSPEDPLPITATTYYVLSPGEPRVRVLTAFCNGSKESLVIPVGDVVERGGVSAFFNPQGCTNGLGAKDCLVDPSEWFGYQADDVAYGYRATKFTGGAPSVNAVLSVAGVVGVVVDGEGQKGLISWMDTNAQTRPGSFGILSGRSRTLLRDFYVGADLGEISSAILAAEASPHSRLNVTVQQADGSPAPGARVAVRVAETGRQVTLLVANSQGVARVDLPPGNYLVGTAALGAAIEALTPVAVPAARAAEVTVKAGATRTLSVTVKDPFQAPLTAKVVVRCRQGPCANQITDYRPWFDVEDQPSDVQAIAFADAAGHATLGLPPGTYEVLVSRGPEYSAWPDTFPAVGQLVDLTSQDQAVEAVLAHVVDTAGWISADLHVHAVGSPDSDVGNATRVASFAAEGVDVLVSTDHDAVTDYAPLVRELGLEGRMATMIGCEVTPFDFGHYNTYPLSRDASSTTGGAFDWAGGDGPTLRLDQLFHGLHEGAPDALIQMNHPRSSTGGGLSQLRVDTRTGASHADPATFRQEANPQATATDTKLFSLDFDALEVMNGTAPSYAVLNDWMTFMSRGWVKVATGVSDTHHARAITGGYGRTWVHVGADEPAQFSASAFAQALKVGKATLSSGPFVTMTAQRLDGGGQPVGPAVELGGTLSLTAGDTVTITVDVQAPEWMQFDAVELYTHTTGREATNGVANGAWPDNRVLEKHTFTPGALPLEAVAGLPGFTARRVHVRETFTVHPVEDTWYVAMVRSSSASRTLNPLAWDSVRCSGGICAASDSRAFAITNPILIDADGTGAYDTFPLSAGQPLTVAPVAPPPVAPHVPTSEELSEGLRRFLSVH